MRMSFPSPSAEAFSHCTMMAPLQVNPGQYTNLEHLLIHTIYALSFCILLCILILFRQIRSQNNPSDLRNHLSEPALDSKRSDQHLTHSPIPLSLRLSTEPSHRLQDSTLTPSAPITSGYLAAKAKVDKARKVDFEMRARARKPDVMASPGATNDTRSVIDETGSSWRRHSYPQPSPSHQSSLLSEDCKFDGTEHFCDGQDARIVWRRRTLTFEGRR
ncbi:uncharacterized protein PV07_12258 [Cladophialophora immunda]|uniref:Uncharacterized protein n=1 Tax=Cladophialophora immunda TaxID=569365 RepID=A0A0D1Z3Y0_9EURO|nr:uncharacterized protein PV07_12258 [Cladophialophora immunda]KIW22366.1 hypothetical protein PV07_12258 [Cladophialophora immunda]